MRMAVQRSMKFREIGWRSAVWMIAINERSDATMQLSSKPLGSKVVKSLQSVAGAETNANTVFNADVNGFAYAGITLSTDSENFSR